MLIPVTKSLLLKRLARVASFLTGTLRKLFWPSATDRGTVYELLRLALLIVVIALGFIAIAYLIILVT